MTMRWLGHGLLFVLLTVLTQIGGAIWLGAVVLCRVLGFARRGSRLLAFAILYASATLALHLAAPLTGREPLPCIASGDLTAASPLYCVLNRNYVTPPLGRIAEAYARHMAKTFPGTRTLALDASFPLFAGFPLLPHLSHDDGRKLDLAFYYEDAGAVFRNGEMRSPLGYFAFEQPEADAPRPCEARTRRLTFRWDLDWLQPFFPAWRAEPQRMREALRWLSTDGARMGIGKVFVEPHIASRLGVSSGIIRFQGCNAARHDDHIHIQLR